MKALHELLQQPFFSPLDRAFAAFVERRQEVDEPLLPIAAAWVSHQLARGHVCLDLSCPPRVEEEEEVHPWTEDWPSLKEWHSAFQKHPMVGGPGDFKPFLLEENRLYLQRYGRCEHSLVDELLHRAGQRPGYNAALLRESLQRQFSGKRDPQHLAAFGAVTRLLLIVSGGHGTGKTTTALNMLALLQEQSPLRPLRFALVAPTGKAAMRLAESMRVGLEKLPVSEEIRQALPREASTLHRLLGSSKQKGRYLSLDVVLVDEASMVDLPLMARLLEAVSETCHVILLGDHEQLASVEAGSVLGDLSLAAGAEKNGIDESLAHEYEKVTGTAWPKDILTHKPSGPLSGNLVVLRDNYRFGNDSQLFGICTAIREGLGEKALRSLQEGSPDVTWLDLPSRIHLSEALKPWVERGFGKMLAASAPAEALSYLHHFRILVPLRKGPFGLYALNALIEQLLKEASLLEPRPGPYPGMPILITRNDSDLRLFNGDLGILMGDERNGGGLTACFDDGAGGVRRVQPLNLPPYEKSFAMTIHKSQGSECDEVLVVLPDDDLPLLTRELIYTALSRARKKAWIWAREEVFLSAVRRKIDRNSGLAEKLKKFPSKFK